MAKVKQFTLQCACGKNLVVLVSPAHHLATRIEAVASASQWRILDTNFEQFESIASLCRTCNAAQTEMKTIRAGHD